MRIFILLLLGAGWIMRAHAAEPLPGAMLAPEWDAMFNRADGLVFQKLVGDDNSSVIWSHRWAAALSIARAAARPALVRS